MMRILYNMYTHIYQNSYIVAIITFIVLCVIFYVFEIGSNTSISNGQVVKSFSWKYPLAITLIVWLIWHFWLYPPKDNSSNSKSTSKKMVGGFGSKTALGNNAPKPTIQRINMDNWN